MYIQRSDLLFTLLKYLIFFVQFTYLVLTFLTDVILFLLIAHRVFLSSYCVNWCTNTQHNVSQNAGFCVIKCPYFSECFFVFKSVSHAIMCRETPILLMRMSVLVHNVWLKRFPLFYDMQNGMHVFVASAYQQNIITLNFIIGSRLNVFWCVGGTYV